MKLIEQIKRDLVREIVDRCKPYVHDSSSAPSDPTFEDKVAEAVENAFRKEEVFRET